MNDRGSVTVVMLAVAAMVLVLAVAVADVGIYFAARFRAAGAADAAALAAAPVTFAPFGGSGSPIAEAQRAAAANGAVLRSCRCPVDRSWEPRVVDVVVALRPRLVGIGTVTVTERSRAEFVPAALLGP